MDEKELEELEALEREALEERDSEQEEIEEDGTTEEEPETKDDSGDDPDGYEDKSTDGEEEKPEVVEEEESKPEFTPIEIEVGGHKVKITSQEDLMAYVTKGAESFNKKEDKFVNEKTILEQGQLTADDLNC